MIGLVLIVLALFNLIGIIIRRKKSEQFGAYCDRKIYDKQTIASVSDTKMSQENHKKEYKEAK